MEQDIIRIAIIVVITWGLWALNNAVTPPKVKEILSIVILVAGCLFLISPLVDVINIALNSTRSH